MTAEKHKELAQETIQKVEQVHIIAPHPSRKEENEQNQERKAKAINSELLYGRKKNSAPFVILYEKYSKWVPSETHQSGILLDGYSKFLVARQSDGCYLSGTFGF